jgi:competence protein ComEA
MDALSKYGDYIMKDTYLSRFYQQVAQVILHRPRSIVGALAFAIALGLNPILASTTGYAQEAAHPVSHANVNINSADAEALAQGLKGVGISRAQEIVRYRTTFGPFASIDELMDVKGVGLSTIEKNRAVLTLE